jgi:hypothetical protein
MDKLRQKLGDEITEPEEGIIHTSFPNAFNRLSNQMDDMLIALVIPETFLVFSQSIPSQNLGFVDSKATTLNLTVAGKDLSITQSPGILSSDRTGGTTGAGMSL